MGLMPNNEIVSLEKSALRQPSIFCKLVELFFCTARKYFHLILILSSNWFEYGSPVALRELVVKNSNPFALSRTSVQKLVIKSLCLGFYREQCYRMRGENPWRQAIG